MKNKTLNNDKPDAVGTDCKECGMFVEHPAEYHTYTYCALMKQLRDGKAARSNIDFTVENHPFVKQLTAERDALLREVEAARRRGGWTYCEDAFPTKPDEYLITYISIYDGKPASGVAEYVRDEWRYDDGDVFTVPVIAWRPLPEPAEIKRSEDEV